MNRAPPRPPVQTVISDADGARMIEARYDTGAMPAGIFAALRRLIAPAIQPRKGRP